jgi:hypothetical protein
MKRNLCSLFMALLLLASPALADAGINTLVSTATMTYVNQETITVSGVPPSISFDNSANPTTGNLNITTTWNLNNTRTHVDMNIFFATPTAVLSDGAGHNIPAANVFASKGGSGYSPCNKPNTNAASELQGVVTSGGVCNVGTAVAITSANQTGSITDAYTFQLQNLSSLGIPAGSYTGIVSFVAGAA